MSAPDRGVPAHESAPPISKARGAFALVAGLGAAVAVIGYRRLTGGARGVKPYQLPVGLLLSLGVLFLVAGGYGLLAGGLKWGVTTTVLGALACRLAWQRRSANDSARL